MMKDECSNTCSLKHSNKVWDCSAQIMFMYRRENHIILRSCWPIPSFIGVNLHNTDFSFYPHKMWVIEMMSKCLLTFPASFTGMFLSPEESTAICTTPHEQYPFTSFCIGRYFENYLCC